MGFLPTLRRQTISLPYNVPARPIGSFGLYAPSHAIQRQLYPAAVQSRKDGAQRLPTSRPVASHRKLLGLLEGSVHEAEHYARQEGAGWLADMARGICCPQGEGGFLWVHEHSSDEWRRVRINEPLNDKSYLYQPPPRMRVGLQTMYQRTVTASSHVHGGPESLVRSLEARDGCCWITRALSPLDASRILPKNMSLAGQQRVLDEFSLRIDALAAPLTSLEDIRLTFFLTHALEHYFERFWLGFRRTSTGAYECHSFVDGTGYALKACGNLDEFPFGTSPLVHGIPVAPPNPQEDDLPPAALFRWHYLQCVIKKFGHDDYLGVPNICVPAAADEFDHRDIGYEREAEFDWYTHLHHLLCKRSQTF